ncbi:MAG: replication initiator protein A [Bacillota bacterium]
MSRNLNCEYYHVDESDQFHYFVMPMLMLTDDRFDISLGAKVVYGLMLNRLSLSRKNNWNDEHGRVYIVFPLDSIQTILKCSKNTALKHMKELDTVDGIGLIERRKTGFGRADTIYVKNFNTGKKVAKKEASDDEFKNCTYGAKTGRLNFSKNEHFCQEIQTASDEIPEEMHNKKVDFTAIDEVEETHEVQKMNHCDTTVEPVEVEKANCRGAKSELVEVQNLNLYGAKSEPVEVQNLNPNNTELYKQDSINKISQSDQSKERLTDWTGENVPVSQEELKDLVSVDFTNEKNLPYHYIKFEYHRHLTQAIHMLTDYENSKIYSEQGTEEQSYFSTVHLFNEALIKMLSAEGTFSVGQRIVTSAKVYDKFVSHVKMHEDRTGALRFEVDELMMETIDRYQSASKKDNGIRYPMAYMMACVWSAMEEGNAKVCDMIRRDFG